MRRAVLERTRPLDAGLSRWYGEIDELARPEQAEIAIRGGERVPLEPRLGNENFTLPLEPLALCFGAAFVAVVWPAQQGSSLSDLRR